MKPEEYAQVVKTVLSERDLLEQLAEECAELSKAALKLIRAKKYSPNYTPTSVDQAEKDFREEVMDVLSIIWLLGVELTPICRYWKFERWAKRLLQ